jgi:hypothetical protein
MISTHLALGIIIVRWFIVVALVDWYFIRSIETQILLWENIFDYLYL